jgi:NADPH:quinone reductase-like Zn-dependent oxidoreductase
MRAVVHDRYGPPDVLRLEDVERPTPNEDQILVRVHATTVSRSDCGWRSGKPFISRFFNRMFGRGGVRRPKPGTILGGEFAGEVEAVGETVSEFAVGDRVFGASLIGAHAEFTCMRASGPVAPMPAGATFEEAAAVCDGFILALGCLRRADVREGRRILVYGASGSIGTAGVQLARYFGAHVTAVCNTKNLELVKSLGADEVIDYTQEDFTENGETYDVIFDAVGKHSFRGCRDSLKPGGTYLPTDGFENAFWLLWTSRIGDRKVRAELPPKYRKNDVLMLKELIETGRYRPVIDRRYPLEDVVEATRYVETQQKAGNVVLIVDGGRAR